MKRSELFLLKTLLIPNVWCSPPPPSSPNSLTSAKCPTTQFNFGTLPGGGVRSHKLRAPFYKTTPLRASVESCGSFVTALVAPSGHRGLILTPSHCAGYSHLPEVGSDSLYLRHHSAISVLGLCSLLGQNGEAMTTQASWFYIHHLSLWGTGHRASFLEQREATRF